MNYKKIFIGIASVSILTYVIWKDYHGGNIGLSVVIGAVCVTILFDLFISELYKHN